MTEISIVENIAKVTDRVRIASQKCDRDSSKILLLAVSKTRSASAIREAANAGITDIGENYLQEALAKIPQLEDLGLRWHFIGPIQSNKTRSIAEQFDWVHSVDREKIARRLNEQRPSHLPPLQICLQVNIDNEDGKAGVSAEQLPQLVQSVQAMDRLCLRGLMAIPATVHSEAEQRSRFRQLCLLQQAMRKFAPQLDTLSMGMSGDLEAAIAEGATIVRIGTDIFGARGG
jgi:pyridoxal phosphate enzyme (YggS family)